MTVNRTSPRKAPPMPNTATAAPVVDYSAMTAEDDTLDPTRRPRENSADLTPFIAWLTDSRARNVGKALVVPAGAEKATSQLIRRAADTLPDCGVSIQLVKQEDGKIRVKFQAKPKRKAEEGKPRKPVQGKRSDADFVKALRTYVTDITAYLTEAGKTDKIDGIVNPVRAEIREIAARMKAASVA